MRPIAPVALMSALLASAASAPAMAQVSAGAPDAAQASASSEDAAVLGEVVVTARRREERLSDVPTAASVVSAEALVQRGTLTNVQGVLANVPGVRFSNTSSPLNSEVSIRGSSTARATSAESAVGLYRDGVYVGGGSLGGRSFTTLDLFDIGRVEVLRGTQGALYGRNAVGGAINIISAAPTSRFEGFALADYGFNNQRPEVQAVVNAPINDYVSTRFGVDYVDQQSGFFYNPDNDRYIDQNKGGLVRGQVRVDKGPLDVVLLAEHGQYLVPGLALRQIYPAGTANAPKGPGYPNGYLQDAYVYPTNYPSTAKQQVNNLRLTADWDLGWAKLTSTSSYRDRKSLLTFDADGLDPATLAVLRAAGGASTIADVNTASESDDRTRTGYQDLHLSGTRGGLTWLGGAEYLHQTDGFVAVTGKTPTKASPSVGTYAPADSTYNSWSAYGSLGYDLTAQLNLTGEVRYTSDRKRTTGNRFDRSTGAQSGGAGFVIDSRYDHDNTSYNLMLSYKPAAGTLLYGKVGSSYRAGGFNNNLGDPRQPVAIPQSYAPEISTSYEAGVKARPLSQVYVTAALYRTDTKDFIAQATNLCAVTNPVCPVNPTSFLVNAGDARSWGAELEAATRLQLFGGDLTADLDGSRQGGSVRSGAYAGQHLPQVPTWLAGANLNYRHPAGALTLFGNLNYHAQWGGHQDINLPGAAATDFPLDDYQIVDLRAGVDAGPWEVAAYANNATAENYVVFYAANTRRSSTPRIYGVQLRYHW